MALVRVMICEIDKSPDYLSTLTTTISTYIPDLRAHILWYDIDGTYGSVVYSLPRSHGGRKLKYPEEQRRGTGSCRKSGPELGMLGQQSKAKYRTPTTVPR